SSFRLYRVLLDGEGVADHTPSGMFQQRCGKRAVDAPRHPENSGGDPGLLSVVGELGDELLADAAQLIFVWEKSSLYLLLQLPLEPGRQSPTILLPRKIQNLLDEAHGEHLPAPVQEERAGADFRFQPYRQGSDRRGCRGSSTGHRQATAHAQHLAGDVARTVAREEEDGVGDVLRFGEPTIGNDAEQSGAHLLRLRLEQGRVGRAGTDAIDADAVARHLSREALSEGDHTALGAGIDRLAHASHPAGVARDVDDPPSTSVDHRREERLAVANLPQIIGRDRLLYEGVVVLHEWLDDV